MLDGGGGRLGVGDEVAGVGCVGVGCVGRGLLDLLWLLDGVLGPLMGLGCSSLL